MIIKGNRGFTLIELLMVIAIIGVLSSIVLVSLNSARNKGNDAKVKSQLSGLRSSAELFYAINGDYGVVTNSCLAGMFINGTSGMQEYARLSNYPMNVTLSCRSNGNDYAVSALLPGSGGIWCVDSRGSAKIIPVNLIEGDVNCN